MNNEPRNGARPASVTLRSLFGWLRGEQRSSSDDSLSSGASDRTALSFAYLHPTAYKQAIEPLPLPPPEEPTDTYRKRVRDSIFRSEYESNLTLHRKYLLPLGEIRYDALSLPPYRRRDGASDRRAASESLPRRAHVPGKRRAPQPPRRMRTIKRPAPQPPSPTEIQKKENLPHPMTADASTTKCDTKKQLESNNTERILVLDKSDNVGSGSSGALNNINSAVNIDESKISAKTNTKSDKAIQIRNKEPKQERSFLKQIFENRKRMSAVEVSHVKLLPSISELDQQAAELMKSYRLKSYRQGDASASNRNSTCDKGDVWFCTRCLRKYDATMVTCLDCLSEAKVSNDTSKYRNSCLALKKSHDSYKNNLNVSSSPENFEDKERLKVMLKEMKDSLPKRSKPNVNDRTTKNVFESNVTTKLEDMCTLPIGSTIPKEIKTEILPIPNKKTYETKILNNQAQFANVSNVMERAVIINAPVVMNPEPKKYITENAEQDYSKKTQNQPLKISELLNPIYIPITNTNKDIVEKNEDQKGKNKPKENGASPLNNVTKTSSDTQTNLTCLLMKTEQTINKIDKGTKITAPATNAGLAMVKDSIPSSKESGQESGITKPSISGVRLSFDQLSKRRNLISQLERSIAKGDEKSAADAATKLAQLRLSCSVLSFSSQIVNGQTRATTSNKTDNINMANNSVELEKLPPNIKYDISANTTISSNEITSLSNNIQVEKKSGADAVASKSCSNSQAMIEVWVEDREAARGPIHLPVPRAATLGDLRRVADETLGLRANLQRWIVGRKLCSDDLESLQSLAGQQLDSPFYLYLVESDKKLENSKNGEQEKSVGNVYNELMQLELRSLIPNREVFECGVCLEECEIEAGVVLRECVHSFCKDCLAAAIRHSEEPAVACPATGCCGTLQEREIRSLVSSEEYERWLARGLTAAESGTRHTFHCRTRDCSGWAFCEPGVQRFPCPVCEHTNCVPCQAIHEGETCEKHRVRLREAAAVAAGASDQTDEGTQALLEAMLARGEALKCPECNAVITKKWGCDWVRCSSCKTEICWVTRGRRWGPAGKGDLSGGCLCGVDGKRCHPSCGYCH